MWNVKHNFILLLISISCTAHGFIQVGTYLSVENTARDTVSPHFIWEGSQSSSIIWSGGSLLSLSSQDLQTLSYFGQAQWNLVPGISLMGRIAQRGDVPESLAHTTFSGLLQLEVSWFSIFRLMLQSGWYHRRVSIKKMSFVPGASSADLTQSDFIVRCGIATQVTPQLSHLMQVSTYDEWESYNLNNPFVENALTLLSPDRHEQWTVRLRYQMLLGFGRLDRLVFGISYGKDF